MTTTLNPKTVNPLINSLIATIMLSALLLANSAYGQDKTPANETEVVYEDDQNTPQDSADKPQNIEDVNRQVKSLTDIAAERDLLLAQQIHSPSPTWLKGGGSKLLGFWQEDLSGAPKGAVIILAKPGTSPVEDGLLFTLQKELPKNGWATLAISAPAHVSSIPPPRPVSPPKPAEAQKETTPGTTDEAAAEDETKVVFEEPAQAAAEAQVDAESNQEDNTIVAAPAALTWDEYAQNAHSSLSAAIGFLHEQGQYNIAILGEGVGAYICLSYIRNNAAVVPDIKTNETSNKTAIIDRAVRTLILLNLDYPSSEEPPSGMLTSPSIPTMDLLNSPANPIAESPDHRKTIAKKTGYDIYIQKRTTPKIPTLYQAKTLKTIRGFLQRYAGGVEL